MYKVNDDMSVYVTRGDIVLLDVKAEYMDKPYTFQPGDLVRIKVFAKKKCEEVVLQKDFPVTAITQLVQIYLSGEDTKIGETISKPKDYWYEVELNPLSEPQTILGYDEDGAKIFKLFPEGADKELKEYRASDEDILSRFMDEELDVSSTHPVQNQAIARGILRIQEIAEKAHEAVAEMYVTPEMFGAIGDGKADDTEAVQKALNAAGENGCVLIPSGVYKVRSLTHNVSNSKIVMHGKFVQMGGHNGTLLTVSGRYIELHNLHLERECTQNGVASEDLRNVGLKITESKNVNVYSPVIKNFNVGILAHSDNSGCAYIDIYSPQIIAYEGIKSDGNAWVNEIHTFGGRISIHETYSDYSGSAYLNLMGDCNRIFGMCLEGTFVERKIKGNFSSSLFIGCRFEGKNKSGTDIEVHGGWNAFIHNRNFNEVIEDHGEGNNFFDYALYKFGSAISKPIVTITSTASENKFEGNWKKPFILADATVASMTISYPTADNDYVKGVEFTVKKIDSSENTVYVYTRNSLDGRQITLSVQNEAITFFSDGSAWRIKDHYIPN